MSTDMDDSRCVFELEEAVDGIDGYPSREATVRALSAVRERIEWIPLAKARIAALEAENEELAVAIIRDRGEMSRLYDINDYVISRALKEAHKNLELWGELERSRSLVRELAKTITELHNEAQADLDDYDRGAYRLCGSPSISSFDVLEKTKAALDRIPEELK